MEVNLSSFIYIITDLFSRNFHLYLVNFDYSKVIVVKKCIIVCKVIIICYCH